MDPFSPRLVPVSRVIQEWLSFTIRIYDISLSSEAQLFAKEAGNRNSEGSEKKDRHNSKREDPLKGNSLDEELVNPERCKSCQ